MVDLQKIIFTGLGFFAELLLHSNYVLCFSVILAFAAIGISLPAAVLVLVGAIFALLASFGKNPSPLPRYKGDVDVLLGRSYKASTRTPEMVANNNVSIAPFGDRLVIAYRKAESHFATPTARLVIATASPGNLEDWEVVWEYTTAQDDLREMLLFNFGGKLFCFFARLAPDKNGFQPRRMQWTCSEDLRTWSKPVDFGRDSEIVWDLKVRQREDGSHVAYKVSYIGNHYAADAVCTVLFEMSTDCLKWEPVGETSAVYMGGVCEVSFAFTDAGDLVAVGRNEDGDRTGFGSQLFFAPKDNLGSWKPLEVSLPQRFDSPRLVCVDGNLLLFARFARESYAAVPKWMPFGLQRFGNLLCYSLLPKAAAVYHLSPPLRDGTWRERPMELIRCFEETYGDTGFFSLAKPDNSKDWIVANYSSSCHSHAPWLYGQVFATDVYVCRCHFIQRS